MPRPAIRPTLRSSVLTGSLALLLLLLAAACGGDTAPAPGGSGVTPPAISLPTPTVDPSLRKVLPAAVSKRGSLSVATNATTRPLTFFAGDGETVVGAEVDLLDAVAAKFGLTTTWQNMPFPKVIPSVASKRYDLGVAGIAVTDERMQTVNQISYLSVGDQWLTAADSSVAFDPKKPCGTTLGAIEGTVELLTVRAVAAKCSADSPVKVVAFAGIDQGIAAVTVGRVDAVLGVSSTMAFAAQESGGKIVTAGPVINASAASIVVGKQNTALAAAMATALGQLKQDGTYDAVLQKWGIADDGIERFEVNPKSR